jgi:hypothetical protein
MREVTKSSFLPALSGTALMCWSADSLTGKLHMCIDAYGPLWCASPSDFPESTLQRFTKSTLLLADTLLRKSHILHGCPQNSPPELANLTNGARLGTLEFGARKPVPSPNNAFERRRGHAASVRADRCCRSG